MCLCVKLCIIIYFKRLLYNTIQRAVQNKIIAIRSISILQVHTILQKKFTNLISSAFCISSSRGDNSTASETSKTSSVSVFDG